MNHGYTRNSMDEMAYSQHHPSIKDNTESLGRQMKPRERYMLKTPEQAPAFDLRCTKTGEGFNRVIRTSEGARVKLNEKK